MYRQRAGAVGSIVLTALLCLTAVSQGAAAPPLQGKMSANATADLQSIIQKTELDMLAIPPCNDADPYFAAAILPHREGAVAICEWMFQWGTNPQLMNISQAVYDSTTEDQIYQAMAYLPPCSTTPAPAPSVVPGIRNLGKVSQIPAVAIRSSIPMKPAVALNGIHDRDFAVQMTAHHASSINMARVELLRGTSEPLKALATDLIVVQTKQNELFRQILQQYYETYI